MYAYIARQPIFDRNCQIKGYELLYRDAPDKNRAEFLDGDQATCRLLSDAVTSFGIKKLTDGKLAYVNFTDNLILNDFVSLANPREIVVELLEDAKVNDQLVEKVKALKKNGYTIALDDYVGNPAFDPLLPYVSWLKVDFMICSPQKQEELARKFTMGRRRIALLAEKVETVEDFERAKKLGYQLFQGYFFAKPQIMSKKIGTLAFSTYGRLLSELQRTNVDIACCARIIQSDVTLTYQLMRQARKLQYYRGNISNAIGQALMILGTDEVRRMVLLSLARENNVTRSDALIRSAYLRGVFIRRLMENCATRENPENGFIMGMFSLLDQILALPMEEILGSIELPDTVVRGLLGEKDNIYCRVLQYAMAYESGEAELPELELNIDENEVAQLYMSSFVETDEAFLVR